MTLEKKIAIASVALCLLTPLVFSIHLVFADSDLLAQPEPPLGQILLFFGSLAWFTGPMIASFILYTRLRSAAVTSAALLALALYAFLSYSLSRDGVQDGSLIWVIYLVWGAACFVLSSLIVLFKPAIFIRSAKSAFFSTLIINLLAAPLAIMIFKTM
jgi:raw score 5.28